MNEYCITLISEDGPFFNISADDFEITKHSLTHKPYVIMFGRGNEIVGSVLYKDVHEVAQIVGDKYIKLDISM